METILVVGADTLVGANFVATLAESHHEYVVHGTSWEEPVHRADGHDHDCDHGAASIARLLGDVRPHRVVLCGAGSESTWADGAGHVNVPVGAEERWIEACGEDGPRVTLVSSDAVFTGPWMFHAENSASFCPSAESEALRRVEHALLERCPSSLVVRTNAFGWHRPDGWVESLLAKIEAGALSVDCIRHGSPVLVTDLIEVVVKAWQAGLDGLYHVGGAERVNPVQWTNRLAAVFHHPVNRLTPRQSLALKPTGFGCGETSLQTRKIRRALGVTLPMLHEGMHRLYEQQLNGYRDHLPRPASAAAVGPA